MISPAAHPTWLLWQPSWIWFPVVHWWSSIFTMFHFSLSLIFHAPTDNFPLGGICHTLRCPCLMLNYHLAKFRLELLKKCLTPSWQATCRKQNFYLWMISNFWGKIIKDKGGFLFEIFYLNQTGPKIKK
jgi:hypothetical protein